MLANGPEMDWTPGDLWRVGLSLPAGGVYEYKYVLVAGGAGSRHALAWQRGNNSVLALGATETEAEVPTARTCAWQRVLPCFLLLRACSALTGAWRSERARPQQRGRRWRCSRALPGPNSLAGPCRLWTTGRARQAR